MKTLLIDDDRRVGRSFTLQFKQLGHECVHCLKGEDGIREAIEGHPDAIILDLDLGPKSAYQGAEVLQAIIDSGLGIPVIIYTNNPSRLLERQYLKKDVAQYVRKTPDYVKLIEKLCDFELVMDYLTRILPDKADTRKPIVHGDITFDQQNGIVTVKGRSKQLGSATAEMLRMLMRNRGAVKTYEQLAAVVRDRKDRTRELKELDNRGRTLYVRHLAADLADIFARLGAETPLVNVPEVGYVIPKV